MTQCWQHSPEYRPNFSTILERIKYCTQVLVFGMQADDNPVNANYPKTLALVPKASEGSWQTDIITLLVWWCCWLFCSIHPHSPIFYPDIMSIHCSCANGCFSSQLVQLQIVLHFAMGRYLDLSQGPYSTLA